AVLEHVPMGVIDTPDGPRMRVLIVAARRDMLERLLKAVNDAGLRPEGIDLAAFAMVRALGSASAAPVLHLAVGGVVNLAVAQSGQCVFTRVVGGGLEAMAIELAERREITVEEARADLQRTGLPVSEGSEAASRGLSSSEDPDVSQTRLVLSDGVRRI